MKRVHLLGVCLLLLGVQSVAYSASMHFNFGMAGKRGDTDVLIAEFLDPGGTGVGKSLSYSNNSPNSKYTLLAESQ
ncbi:MAG: hypothetical protein OEU26_05365 [Candidatus Tectomicrobia bacterium]|nr:hypothetical protein [Candidatus Tectomicrobia bacterium]